MNMEQGEMTGLMVLISPVLWTSDHAGKIATIAVAEPHHDNFWVRLEDDKLDCFSSRTLFIFRTTEELNELAENRFGSLWEPIPEYLKAVAAAQATGSSAMLKKAYQLVQDDPELQRVATIRLNEVIGLHQTPKIGR